MCGIFGYIGKTIRPKSHYRTKSLEYRGYDSAESRESMIIRFISVKKSSKISSLEKKIEESTHFPNYNNRKLSNTGQHMEKSQKRACIRILTPSLIL